MPLTNLAREMDPNEPKLSGTYHVGVIVDNNDPEKLDRLKIRCPDIHRGIEDDGLPWAVPVAGPGANANGIGHVNAGLYPIGGKVYYILQDDTPWFPMFLGARNDQSSILQELLEDYPNSYGRIDQAGNLWKVNTKTKTVKFTHVSGAGVEWGENGSFKKIAADGSESHITGDWTVAVSGQTNLSAGGNMYIKGANVFINSSGGISPEEAEPRTPPEQTSFSDKKDY